MMFLGLVLEFSQEICRFAILSVAVVVDVWKSKHDHHGTDGCIRCVAAWCRRGDMAVAVPAVSTSSLQEVDVQVR